MRLEAFSSKVYLKKRNRLKQQTFYWNKRNSGLKNHYLSRRKLSQKMIQRWKELSSMSSSQVQQIYEKIPLSVWTSFLSISPCGIYWAAQLRQPIENSLILCHLKTLRFYTGLFKFEHDNDLTNVARVKSLYTGWQILFIKWSHNVWVTWYS